MSVMIRSSNILKLFALNVFLCVRINSTEISTSDIAIDAAIESTLLVDTIPCPSSDPLYENSLKINKDVRFFWTSDEVFLNGRLKYNGIGWLGFGISDSSGAMAGADAIIGHPDLLFENEPAVFKYDIDSDRLSGIVPMEESLQTLEGESLTQDSNTTVLSFTKFLYEDGEKRILPSGENTFIWAAGKTNTLGQQRWRSFNLDLSNCDDITNLEAEMEAASTIMIKGDSSSNSKKTAFIIHGLLGGFAWSVCASFAVATAWFRRIAPTWWIYMHVLANVACFLLTLICFIVVIVAVENNPNTDHFSRSHHYVGIVLMMFVTGQVMNGFLRPPVKKEAVSAYRGNQEERSWSARDSWHFVHKYSGVTLLILSLYQVSSGLHLYSKLFGSKSLVKIYWGTVFTCLIFVLAIKLGIVFDLRPKSTFDGNKQHPFSDVDFSANADELNSL